MAPMHARPRSRAEILFVVDSVPQPLPQAGGAAILSIGGVEPEDPFVQLLLDDGYGVTVAEGTTQAIAYLDGLPPPDVFVADIQTPRLDAVFIARYARSRHPLLPI